MSATRAIFMATSSLMKEASFEHLYLMTLSLIFRKIVMEWGKAFLQLPLSYPQLPFLLVDQNEILMWRIEQKLIRWPW